MNSGFFSLTTAALGLGHCSHLALCEKAVSATRISASMRATSRLHHFDIKICLTSLEPENSFTYNPAAVKVPEIRTRQKNVFESRGVLESALA
jgi:hypothetical protein